MTTYAQNLPGACVLYNDEHAGYALINPMPQLYIPAVKNGNLILPLNTTGPGPVTYWFGSETDAWRIIEERMRDAEEARDAER